MISVRDAGPCLKIFCDEQVFSKYQPSPIFTSSSSRSTRSWDPEDSLLSYTIVHIFCIFKHLYGRQGQGGPGSCSKTPGIGEEEGRSWARKEGEFHIAVGFFIAR